MFVFVCLLSGPKVCVFVFVYLCICVFLNAPINCYLVQYSTSNTEKPPKSSTIRNHSPTIRNQYMTHWHKLIRLSQWLPSPWRDRNFHSPTVQTLERQQKGEIHNQITFRRSANSIMEWNDKEYAHLLCRWAEWRRIRVSSCLFAPWLSLLIDEEWLLLQNSGE